MRETRGRSVGDYKSSNAGVFAFSGNNIVSLIVLRLLMILFVFLFMKLVLMLLLYGVMR